MKLKIFIITLSLFASSMCFAQYCDVHGIVVDAYSGAPLAYVNIIVEGTSRGAATDTTGCFIIENLPAGNYTIKSEMMGYETAQKKVIVQPDAAPNIRFEMRESFFQAEQIVVTATRTKKLLEDVPVVIESIGRAEILESGAENLAEILEDRPGITIEEGVAGGKLLRMNGIDSKYILILVDGLPISGKFNNRTELNLIEADQIDHVEIVKGASSALYGSEAMGGVINIITKGFTEDFNVSGRGKLGSYDLYSGNIAVSGELKGLGYLFALDHDQGGINRNEISIDVTDSRASHATTRLRLNAPRLGAFSFKGDIFRNIQNGQDPVFNNETRVEQLNSHIEWKKSVGNRANIALRGYISDNSRTYSETVIHSGHLARIDSTRENLIGFKSDMGYVFGNTSRIDFGLDYSHNGFDSERVINRNVTRSQIGFFTQAEIKYRNKLTLLVGGRFDKISDIDAHVSPRLSGMYVFSPQFKVRGSIGGGFRAPSYTDMYIDYDNIFVGYSVIGNPDLKPEKAKSANIGFEYFWNYTVLFNLNIYRNELTDMILDYTIAPAVLSYRNIDRADFTGLEWQCKLYLMKNLTSILSYNYTRIEQSEVSEEISNISPHSATVKLNYGLFKNRLKISLRNQFYSDKKVREYDRRIGEFSKELKTKKAYNILDLTLTVRINKLLSLQLGGANLNDYTDNLYGPWIGRRLFSSLVLEY